jgi:hypothetical protein
MRMGWEVVVPLSSVPHRHDERVPRSVRRSSAAPVALCVAWAADAPDEGRATKVVEKVLSAVSLLFVLVIGRCALRLFCLMCVL